MAYVIYGDEPIGISGFWNPTVASDRPLMSGCSSKSSILKRGYKLHRKYQPLLQSKNLIFLFQETGDYVEVTLVNRRNFLKAVAESPEDFQRVLGAEVSGESILAQFIQEEEILAKPLKENHALLGILLGYGKKDASTFHRKMEIVKSRGNFIFMIKETPCPPPPASLP